MREVKVAQHDTNAVFELWRTVKRASELAKDCNLSDVELSLKMSADTILYKYSQTDVSILNELKTLLWDKDEWPASAALLMEMKDMIIRMEGSTVEEFENIEVARQQSA